MSKETRRENYRRKVELVLKSLAMLKEAYKDTSLIQHTFDNHFNEVLFTSEIRGDGALMSKEDLNPNFQTKVEIVLQKFPLMRQVYEELSKIEGYLGHAHKQSLYKGMANGYDEAEKLLLGIYFDEEKDG